LFNTAQVKLSKALAPEQPRVILPEPCSIDIVIPYKEKVVVVVAVDISKK